MVKILIVNIVTRLFSALFVAIPSVAESHRQAIKILAHLPPLAPDNSISYLQAPSSLANAT